jgi:hypothetical protein
MKCEYDDGLKVDYGTSLRIAKGDEVNVFIKEGFIPGNIKGELTVATVNYSCSEMREVAERVIGRFGKKACIHQYQ